MSSIFDTDLKKFIDKKLRDDESADISELTRQWLSQQDFLSTIIKAINGEKINGEVLKLKDRIAFGLKLSNKLIPDLKSTEQKKIFEGNFNLNYQATKELLDRAGCYEDAVVIPEEVKQIE